MSALASRVIGIIAIVLSAGSAVGAIWYWFVSDPPRTKHGLLFAAIFVILLLFGLVSVRARGKGASEAPPPK